MIKPKVLVVEDEETGRSVIANTLRREFGFQVCEPANPEALAECLATETFDGAIIDVKLEIGPWKIFPQGRRMSGGIVKDGNDVKRVALKLNAQIPIKTYSTQVNLRDPETIRINKPINPYDKTLKEALKFVGQDTNRHVRSIGPWLVGYQKYNSLTFNERIHSYKKALSLNAKRLKRVFIDLGNVAWLLLGKKKIRLCGESLIGDDSNPFKSVVRTERIDQKAIDQVAKGYFPFPFWNTGSKLEYLDKQFELAGPDLSNFPLKVRELFSISVADACAEAYVKDPDKNILRWSPKLTREGRIQISKKIFKRLSGHGQRGYSLFIRNTERLCLPRIVEIYDARVDKIDVAKSAAWIELRKFGEERISLVEAFDLTLLKDMGVRHQHQRFEYSVYRWIDGSLGMNIELAPDNDQPLFSFLD